MSSLCPVPVLTLVFFHPLVDVSGSRCCLLVGFLFSRPRTFSQLSGFLSVCLTALRPRGSFPLSPRLPHALLRSFDFRCVLVPSLGLPLGAFAWIFHPDGHLSFFRPIGSVPRSSASILLSSFPNLLRGH